MKLRYPFLYLVLASSLAAVCFLIFHALRDSSSIPSAVRSDKRVALVDVSGILTSSHDVSRNASSSVRIIEELEKYGDDDSIKAVVLRINSPGGTVVASQEIYEALKRLRHERGKIIVASMADVSASGGYYIACAADRIIANPGTITGSIGVIMEFPNVTELFGRIGISSTTIKSGEFKDTGNALREMTESERKILQSLIDDVYEQFVEVVAAGRKMTRQEVVQVADGRIFSGRQAKERQLVDSLGDLDSAIMEAALLAGIEGRPVVVKEKRKKRIWEILESRIGVFLPSSFPGFPAVSGGGLLYLWR